MHERDLRRVALESGKTTSRKAKAKAFSSRSSQAGSTANSPSVSPNHSPGGSRAGSRAVSRHGSEDDSDESDDLTSSVASLDIKEFSKYEKADAEVAFSDLRDVSEQIIERTRTKRNTTEAREENLAVYTNILRAQYAPGEIDPLLADLIPALLKCFRAGSAEGETIYALKALSMTVLTMNSGDEPFVDVQDALRSRIQDASSRKAQETAMHTLGICAFFGGADVQDVEDIMDFFLDIIETDGESIEANDSAAVVSAALQAWGFLATMFEDLEGKTDRPLECFENQLDSSHFAVQQAAAENIALLYEQSWTQKEDDETADVGSDHYEHGSFQRKHWKQRYSPYHNNADEYSVKAKLSDISRSTARHVAKDKRKALHQVAKDVLHTIEHPYRGPRFSTAIDEDDVHYLGHRLTVRFGGRSSGMDLVLDRWWKYHRYEAVKRAVAGGFVEHYSKNMLIRNAIPRGTLVAPTDF